MKLVKATFLGQILGLCKAELPKELEKSGINTQLSSAAPWMSVAARSSSNDNVMSDRSARFHTNLGLTLLEVKTVLNPLHQYTVTDVFFIHCSWFLRGHLVHTRVETLKQNATCPYEV